MEFEERGITSHIISRSEMLSILGLQVE